VDSWSYFHAVAVVHLSHLSPGLASMLILVGGGIGLVGFGRGAWASEYFGRVRTVAVMWPLAAMGALWSGGPPVRDFYRRDARDDLGSRLGRGLPES